MIGRDIAAFLTGLIIIAVVFVLVRPGSEGVHFVTALGNAIANMLQAASGGATQESTGTGTASTTAAGAGSTTGQGSATASTGGTA